MAYATVDELTDELGYTPNNAQKLLDRASRDISQALLTALYTPDDAAFLATAKEATLEQVAWRLECGDVNGIRHDAQSGVPSGPGAGSVSLGAGLGNAVGAATYATQRYGDQVKAILQQADSITWVGPITWAGG